MSVRLLSTEGREKRKGEALPRGFPDQTDLRTYAEELGEIRSKTKPENSDAEVRSIRQTRSGDLLLDLGAGIKDKTVFRDTLINILGDKATVRQFEPRITLEIRDLDSLTINQEVEEAIGRNLPDLTGNLKVWTTKADSRELKTAVAELSIKGTSQLLKLQSIKIGWISCRVRQVPRIRARRPKLQGPRLNQALFQVWKGRPQSKRVHCPRELHALRRGEQGQGRAQA